MKSNSSDQPRIFLIGFNKCGTTSFHDYFKANGIASVHWRANTLALALHHNRTEGRPLLEGIDHWTAYTDMNCIPGSPWGQSNSDSAALIEGCRYFRELHRDYPDALFILNTRDPLIGCAPDFSTTRDNSLRPTNVAWRPGHSHQTSTQTPLAQGLVRAPCRSVELLQTVAPTSCCSTSRPPPEEANRFLKPHFPIT